MVSASKVSKASINQPLLDQVNQSGNWFHAGKTKPLWARKVRKKELVSSLEGDEWALPGHYICRGAMKDRWVQSSEKLFKKYKQATKPDPKGWSRFEPIPSQNEVMAVQVESSFSVQTSWGKLSGKPGDYLLKSYGDHAVELPEDVWIVDRAIFEDSYQAINS